VARIVVGIDGSDHAKEALRWALDEARLRGASLEVVHTWFLPAYTGYGYTAALIEPQGLIDAATETLEKTVDEVCGSARDVQVERKVVQGAAAEVLATEAAGADLLVVGSRGHGGFAGLLLGSVSQQCAHHAPCPVVIVRAVRPARG
jgi:nucleotide-binding universal stress UspA family protein